MDAAATLLAHLQAECGVHRIHEVNYYAPNDVNAEAYKAALRAAFRDRVTMAQDPHAHVLLAALDEMLGRAAGALGIDLNASRRPLFGSVPSHIINAQIIYLSGDSRPLVIFEEGLFSFVSLACTAFIRGLVPAIQASSAGESEADFCTRVADCLKDDPSPLMEMGELFVVYLTTGNPWKVSHNNLFLQEPWGYYMHSWRLAIELFVMGHEWGHLIRGHLDPLHLHKGLVGSSDVLRLVTSRQQEHEADIIGFRLAMAAMINEGLPVWLPITAVGVFLHWLDSLERCIAILTTGRDEQLVTESHPSAADRLALHQEWIQRNMEPTVARMALERLESYLSLSELFLRNARQAVGQAQAGGATLVLSYQ